MLKGWPVIILIPFIIFVIGFICFVVKLFIEIIKSIKNDTKTKKDKN